MCENREGDVMTMVTIGLDEEADHKLRLLAEAAGQTLEGYVLSAVLRASNAQPPARPPGRNGPPRDPLALSPEMLRLINRTPEQIAADRAELLKTARPARPLPEGKTLSDVVCGTWPGDETDEEIRQILEELS